MSKFFFVPIVVLLLAVGLMAQQPRTEWSILWADPDYQDIYPASVCTDAAGAIYVAGTGYHNILGGPDLLLAKYNASGQQLWSKGFDPGTTLWYQARELLIDPAGDLILTGSFEATCVNDVVQSNLAIKYSPAGDVMWEQYDVSLTCSLHVYINDWHCDDAGNLYMCGKSGTDSGMEDLVVAKYDANGDLIWLREVSDPAGELEEAKSIDVDAAGNVYVCGVTSVGFVTSIATLKFSPDGDQEWLREVPRLTEGRDYGRKIKVDHEGNIVAVGIITVTAPPLDYDIMIVKYTPAGDTLWARRHAVAAGLIDDAVTIGIDSDNNIIVGSRVKFGPDWIVGGDWDVFKYSSSGDLLWSDIYDGAAHALDGPGLLLINNNDEVVTLGLTDYIDQSAPINPADMLIRKNGADGAVIWSKTYFGLGSSFEFVEGLALHPDGGWIAIGATQDSLYHSETFIVKYSDYICGDSDGNGTITISDVVFMITYVFGSGPAPDPPLAADADCDGILTISDAVYLIAFIFGGGPAPCSNCP